MIDPSIHCRRCGVSPGEKSTCTGGYTSHDFRSTLPQSRKKDSHIDKKAQFLTITIGDANTPAHDEAPKVSILFMAADPTDASRLRLGGEFREIKEKLNAAQLRDYFKLELPQLSVRPADISQVLLDLKPRIVHFSGHGSSDGALCIEDQKGKTTFVKPEVVAALFEQFANHINCVVLNACFSRIQAEAIAKHIEYVVGMNQAISDKAAIAYAVGFYQAIGAGRPTEAAHALGCVQVGLCGIPEHDIPVLIKRKKPMLWGGIHVIFIIKKGSNHSEPLPSLKIIISAGCLALLRCKVFVEHESRHISSNLNIKLCRQCYRFFTSILLYEIYDLMSLKSF